MSNQFKGKKLVIINDYQKGDYGTYPKMILRNTELTLLDKLILIVCHSYPTKDKNGNAMQWTLAYTRIAKEINCDQSHLICRWKHLINCNYIIEGIDTYTINYDAIINNFKVPPIINNKRTQIGFIQSGSTRVTPPAVVNPAGSVTPATKPDPATRVTPDEADRVTPVEQQGFSEAATRVTPVRAARVTPANEYKEYNKEKNQQEKQDLINNRSLDFNSLFFTGNTKSKVKDFFLDFISDKEERKSIEYNQFEKMYVISLENIYVNSGRVMTKENLYEEINKVKSSTLSIKDKNIIDIIRELLKSEPEYLNDFNSCCDKYRLNDHAN
jgi:hypothetical protein